MQQTQAYAAHTHTHTHTHTFIKRRVSTTACRHTLCEVACNSVSHPQLFLPAESKACA
jgi:hypothetical protein